MKKEMEKVVFSESMDGAIIDEVVRDQEKADIMQDKLNVKEYEDPFKG